MEELKAIFKKDDTVSMKIYNLCELRKALIDETLEEFKIKIYEKKYTIKYNEDTDWFFINNDENNPLNYEDLIEYFFKIIFK